MGDVEVSLMHLGSKLKDVLSKIIIVERNLRMSVAKPLLLKACQLRAHGSETPIHLFFGPFRNKTVWLIQATVTHEDIYNPTNLRDLELQTHKSTGPTNPSTYI